jgi:hypothetical protein
MRCRPPCDHRSCERPQKLHAPRSWCSIAERLGCTYWHVDCLARGVVSGENLVNTAQHSVVMGSRCRRRIYWFAVKLNIWLH